MKRIGFLGTGWIGRHRMQAILDTGMVEATAIADPSPECRAEAAALAPKAALVESLEDLLALEVDGIVIATPSALHAAQAIAALEKGVAVFCQKPLGRTADEAQAVINAARAAGRLLEVDLSYRHTEAMRRIKDLVTGGQLGRVFACDLIFHNAYGPDKDWFYDPRQSGGGCVMDLGVHLVDLALWIQDFPKVTKVSGTLLAGGEPLGGRADRTEDYATATLEMEGGTTIRIACSWRLHAGQEAQIAASFYGTEGGAEMRNVNGSFYDFEAWHNRGTKREMLLGPPDSWGGRAAADWARRLASGEGFDPACEHLAQVATLLDRIYGR
jgi:predicted dehydrogenase